MDGMTPVKIPIDRGVFYGIMVNASRHEHRAINFGESPGSYFAET